MHSLLITFICNSTRKNNPRQYQFPAKIQSAIRERAAEVRNSSGCSLALTFTILTCAHAYTYTEPQPRLAPGRRVRTYRGRRRASSFSAGFHVFLRCTELLYIVPGSTHSEIERQELRLIWLRCALYYYVIKGERSCVCVLFLASERVSAGFSLRGAWGLPDMGT